jgi:hypothetical protein
MDKAVGSGDLRLKAAMVALKSSRNTTKGEQKSKKMKIEKA